VRPPTFVTIATADRAAQSRVLARSARACHADARLAVLVLAPEGARALFEGTFDVVVTAEELSVPCFADMRFRYSTPELCFALKPWIIGHLFNCFADSAIYYFDSDIEIFGPLVEAEVELARGANLLLSAHILRPAPDQASEEALLRSGTFNGGFLAVAPTAEGRAFVAWWRDRLRTGCTLEATCGDQRWLDLAPAMFDGVAILRHRGYNFAFWNAHERPLVLGDGGWSVEGEPLRFVHYTKWNLREQSWQQYLAQYFSGDHRSISPLFAEYQDKVWRESRPGEESPWSEGEVLAPRGKAVPPVVRAAYARHGPSLDGDADAVFAHAVAVLNEPSKSRADLPVPVTLLYDETWQRQAHLRDGFDIDRVTGRLDYLRWLGAFGATELGIPHEFLTLARSALDDGWARQFDVAITAGLPSNERSEIGEVAAEWLPIVSVGSAGERGAAGISAKPDHSGHIIFGPYARLGPGSYRVQLRCSSAQSSAVVPGGRPAAVIEAVAHHGRHYLAQHELSAADCRVPVHELHFRVGPAPLLAIEVRVWTSGTVPLTVTSIRVERLPAGQ
jgi:hypothetical protein